MSRKDKCERNLRRATSGAESCLWSGRSVLRLRAGFPFLIRWSCKTPPVCLKMSESSMASLPAPWMSRRLMSLFSLTTRFFGFFGWFDKSLMHASIRALMSPVRTASFTTWPKSGCRPGLRSRSGKGNNMGFRTSEILNHYVLVQFSGQGETLLPLLIASFRVFGLSAGNTFCLVVWTSLGHC